jgi:hypothetical protein
MNGLGVTAIEPSKVINRVCRKHCGGVGNANEDIEAAVWFRFVRAVSALAA